MRVTILVLLTLLLTASTTTIALLPLVRPASALSVAEEGMAYYWAKTYGSLLDDLPLDMAITEDGDIVLAGTFFYQEGSSSLFVFKVDGQTGDVLWAKTYDIMDIQTAYGLAITPDGDILVAGFCWDADAGAYYALLLRLDSDDGSVMWQKHYGEGRFSDIIIGQDGYAYVIGLTNVYGAGDNDVWVLKLDTDDGAIVWQMTYGGADSDVGAGIVMLPDGSLIAMGGTLSFGAGWLDVLVLKLDRADGHVIKAVSLGGPDMDGVERMAVTPDGDVIIAGSTASFGSGEHDGWLIRLDGDDLSLKWAKAYGGANLDGLYGLTLAPDGSIVVTGSTASFGTGEWDLWLMKLDAYGNIAWQRAYGGAFSEWGDTIAINSNGDVFVVGITNSFGVGGGYYDIWLLKTDTEGSIKDCLLCTETEAISTPTDITPILILGLTGTPSAAAPHDVSAFVMSISPSVSTQCWAEVDVAPPEVAITSPSEGSAIGGTITVQVDASDNVGVERVEFYIDGDLAYTDDTAPYEYEWDTTSVADGSHTIRAVAYDAEGNSGEDEVNVVVDNVAPVIISVSRSPEEPVEGESVTITVQASDATSGIAHVILYYHIGGGSWTSVEMSPVASVWTATIPGQSAGTMVEYYVEVVDEAGNSAQSVIEHYTVASKPAPPPTGILGMELWQLVLIVCAIAIVIILAIIAVKK